MNKLKCLTKIIIGLFFITLISSLNQNNIVSASTTPYTYANYNTTSSIVGVQNITATSTIFPAHFKGSYTFRDYDAGSYAGWTVVSMGVSAGVMDLVNYHNKVMHVKSSGTYTMIEKTLEYASGTSGNQTVEFYASGVFAYTYWICALYIRDASGKHVYWGFNDYYSDSRYMLGNTAGESYFTPWISTPNLWHHVKLELDYTNAECGMTINGTWMGKRSFDVGMGAVTKIGLGTWYSNNILYLDSLSFSWFPNYVVGDLLFDESSNLLNRQYDLSFANIQNITNIQNYTIQYSYYSNILQNINCSVYNYVTLTNQTMMNTTTTNLQTYQYNQSYYSQNYFNVTTLNFSLSFNAYNTTSFIFNLQLLNVTVTWINFQVAPLPPENVEIFSESEFITKWNFTTGSNTYLEYLSPFNQKKIYIPTGCYNVTIYQHEILNYTYLNVNISTANVTTLFFYKNVSFGGGGSDFSDLYTYLDERFNTLFGYIESNFTYTNNYLVEINGNLTSLSTYIGNNFTLLQQYLGSNFTYIDNYLSTLNTYLDGNFTVLNALLDLRFDSIDSYLAFMNFYLDSNFTNMDLYYNDISTWFSDLNIYLSTELGIGGTLYTYLVAMNGDLTNYLTLFESSMNTHFDVLDDYFTALNVYLNGNFSLLSSYIATNFTSLNNRLALYNAWMGSNFTSLMDYLIVLDGFLNANFTNIMDYLTIINNAITVIDGFVDDNYAMLVQLGVNVGNINTKLDFINSWMGSNFTNIFAYFDSLDIYFDGLDQYLTNEFGNLTQYMQGNFTTLQTQLYLHDQWVGSNFTSVFAYLDALNGYFAGNFTALYLYMSGNFTALQIFLGNNFNEIWNNFTIINGYLASNFTDIFAYFDLLDLYFINLNHTINNTEYNLTAFLTLMGNNTEILDHLTILNNYWASNFTNMFDYFIYLNSSISNCCIAMNQSISNLAIYMNWSFSVINQTITIQYTNLSSYMEFFYTQFAGNMTNLVTLIGSINGTGSGNLTVIIEYLNNLNTTINTDYANLYAKLLDIENEILFINGTIYNTKITVDIIADDINIEIEQNDYLTTLYETTLFSIFLNWTDIGRNITKLQEQILQLTLINHDPFNRTVFFKYHNFIIELPLLAESELIVYIPSTLVYYMVFSIVNISTVNTWDWHLVTDDITYIDNNHGYITFGFSIIDYLSQNQLIALIVGIGLIGITCIGGYVWYSNYSNVALKMDKIEPKNQAKSNTKSKIKKKGKRD